MDDWGQGVVIRLLLYVVCAFSVLLLLLLFDVLLFKLLYKMGGVLLARSQCVRTRVLAWVW